MNSDRKVPRIPPKDEIRTVSPEAQAEAEKKFQETKAKIYKRNGFKRTLSGIGLLVGGALTLIPATSAIGQGVVILSGAGLAVGLGHADVKRSAQGKASITTLLVQILQIIISYIKRK